MRVLPGREEHSAEQEPGRRDPGPDRAIHPANHAAALRLAHPLTPTRGAGGGEPLEDSEKRESFAQLRARYADARKLVSLDEPHSNLEWILGARRNIAQDPPRLEPKTLELAALWLQDMAVAVDQLTPPPPGDFHPAGKLAAQSLRDATVRFLLAFGISPANRTGGSVARRLDGRPSR